MLVISVERLHNEKKPTSERHMTFQWNFSSTILLCNVNVARANANWYGHLSKTEKERKRWIWEINAIRHIEMIDAITFVGLFIRILLN